MSRLLDSLNRPKRSLLARAQTANRRLRNLLKQFRKTVPVARASLSELGAPCDSKAELLASTRDGSWRLAAGATVSCANLKDLVASPGCSNRAALERSLSENCFQTPEILIGRFHNCVAQPRVIRLITQDSDLASETSSIHDVLDPDLLDSDHLILRQAQILGLVRHHTFVDEDVLFAFNSFTPSYGHYALTSLPLISFFKEEIRQGLLKIVFPAEFPGWMKAHLFELGLAAQNFLSLPNSSYRFRSAIVSNILDAGNTRAPNPRSLAFAADVLEHSAPGQRTGKKLYVRRSGAADVSSRTISNEREVIDALDALGFDVIEPGRMSLQQQAHAFHYAEIVVSPHGSSLANLIFCGPGAKVLDLMADDWVGARGDSIRDVWGLRMCALKGLQYSVLLCPSQVKARHSSGNPVIEYRVVVDDLLASLRGL